jgi:hypothetical protein
MRRRRERVLCLVCVPVRLLFVKTLDVREGGPRAFELKAGGYSVFELRMSGSQLFFPLTSQALSSLEM